MFSTKKAWPCGKRMLHVNRGSQLVWLCVQSLNPDWQQPHGSKPWEMVLTARKTRWFSHEGLNFDAQHPHKCQSLQCATVIPARKAETSGPLKLTGQPVSLNQCVIGCSVKDCPKK